MDFALDIKNTGVADMTFDKEDSIINNIYLSLMIDKGSFFQDQDFGSRLYLLKRSKNVADTVRLARDYCHEALEWMIETGKAIKFEINTQIEKLTGTDRLKIQIIATESNGNQVEFSTFKEIV
ncbi:MAG: phage GP46 family protein [Desulfobacula sp.]|nr:phage GP46 family protein [Desulfobacula sp.]